MSPGIESYSFPLPCLLSPAFKLNVLVDMVNSCSAHLEGEWAEVVIQGVFLEERTLAEPRGGGDGNTSSSLPSVHFGAGDCELGGAPAVRQWK